MAVLLPTSCPVCGVVGPAPCAPCWRMLRPAPIGPPPDGLDWCASLIAYEGAGRELLARLKYRNARSSLRWLVDGMAQLVDRASIDVVTWAPTTPARRRERGFDQAAELAAGVARRLDLPCRRLLARAPGPPQTGLPVARRRTAPHFVAQVGRRAPGRVLLVDDVVTSGATVSAAARALRLAGAAEISALCAGRTPLKVVSRPADA